MKPKGTKAKAMKRLGIAIATVIALGSVGHAEPNEIAKVLLNQPISMMNFGIYRLQDQLDKDLRSERGVGAIILYDSENNKITVNLSRDGLAIDSSSFASDCRQVLESTRRWANVFNGKLIGVAPFGSRMASYFMPLGVVNGIYNYGNEIDSLFELKFMAIDGDKARTCSAPLLGTYENVVMEQ